MLLVCTLLGACAQNRATDSPDSAARSPAADGSKPAGSAGVGASNADVGASSTGVGASSAGVAAAGAHAGGVPSNAGASTGAGWAGGAPHAIAGAGTGGAPLNTASAGMVGAAGAAGVSGDAGRASTSDPAGNPDTAALPGWKLVWHDEFDGAKGAKLDSSRWVYETGGGGWGNNQLEYDTDRADNAALDGAGQLTITALKESYMGKSYTSVRLKTEGKFEHAYGRYEPRIRIPFAQGMWPAFWLLGVDPNNVGWPARGEIDVMENVGFEPGTIHGTIHGPGYSGERGLAAASTLEMNARFADDYHLFAVEWEKDVVRWYVDGKLYHTRTPADLPSGSKWVYDHSFYLLLNLAVGGQWPGSPDNTTMFPQTMKVDYVRVYDRK